MEKGQTDWAKGKGPSVWTFFVNPASKRAGVTPVTADFGHATGYSNKQQYPIPNQPATSTLYLLWSAMYEAASSHLSPASYTSPPSLAYLTTLVMEISISDTDYTLLYALWQHTALSVCSIETVVAGKRRCGGGIIMLVCMYLYPRQTHRETKVNVHR